MSGGRRSYRIAVIGAALALAVVGAAAGEGALHGGPSARAAGHGTAQLAPQLAEAAPGVTAPIPPLAPAAGGAAAEGGSGAPAAGAAAPGGSEAASPWDWDPAAVDWEAWVTWKDTLAQWVMAALGVVVTLIGALVVLLLRRTLRATQEAVAESRRAAKAAEHAAEVTREVGIAQVRAYLTVQKPRARIDGGFFDLRFEYLNTGNSPARRVVIRAGAYISFGSTHTFPERIEHDLLTNIDELPAGVRGGSHMRIEQPYLGDDDIPRIAIDWSYANCTIEILYDDVFGIERKDVFAFIAMLPPGRGMADYVSLYYLPKYRERRLEAAEA